MMGWSTRKFKTVSPWGVPRKTERQDSSGQSGVINLEGSRLGQGDLCWTTISPKIPASLNGLGNLLYTCPPHFPTLYLQITPVSIAGHPTGRDSKLIRWPCFLSGEFHLPMFDKIRVYGYYCVFWVCCHCTSVLSGPQWPT